MKRLPRAVRKTGRGALIDAARVCGWVVALGLSAYATWGASTFSNTTSLTIPGSGTGNANPSSPASLYPSGIVVSGVVGTVSKVTVTLNGLSHAVPDDIDILLVAPTGAQLDLFSDVGGTTAAASVTITLDDAAASQLPNSGPLVSGTFQPTSVNSGISPNTDNFPSPAPAVSSPADFAAPFGSATLATKFNGINPNGTWNLYIVDDKLGDTGSLSGGWSITITTASAAGTVTTVNSSLNPSFTSAPNNSVTFAATVTSSAVPVTVGTVTFKEGSTTLGGPVALNGSGQAAFTTASLGEGSHVISAFYNGDPNFGTSNGSVTQTVDNHTTVAGTTFCNPGAITIPNPADASGGAASGSGAKPFPSHIFVSGLSGSISKVTVQLTGLSHAFPDDIDMLLVGPNGAKMVIFSDVGGGVAVNNLNITLDDAAGSALSDSSALSTGTFRPTAVNSGSTSDSFPSPAPAAPYEFAAPFGSDTLASAFGGADPNGTWSLYVADDKAGDTGVMSGGWCLTFTTTADQATTTTVNSSRNPAFSNDLVTYTATVSSSGNPVTSGTVTFKEGATILAGPSSLDGNGQAGFATSLTEGSHVITAEYSGSPGQFNISNGSVTEKIDNHTVVSGGSFCNPGSITTPGTGTGDPSGDPSSPYPSHIFVSGLSGVITKVTVTLNNLTHPFPDDLDMLLVGPHGETFVPWSDVGGGNAVNNISVILDDTAGPQLADEGALSSGTFKPTAVNAGGSDAFPAPAPGPSYNFAAPFGTATFASVFDGIDPNGTWSLYVVDDKLGDSGALAGGWCLNITTTPAVVSVSSTAADGAYAAGQSIPITVTFNQPVSVTGTPQLTLETGTSDAVVNYSSGSGTDTLTFNYAVGAGDTSSDLDYVSSTALALNGGTISSGPVAAILTLPTPGAAGSLGANKNIVIDTTPPTVAISAPSVSTTATGPVDFTVTYSDANFSSSSLAPGNVTLNATETASGSISVSGGGSSLTVTISSITGHGTLGISIAANTGTDLAGNQAGAAGPSATFIVNNPPLAGVTVIQRYPTQGVKVSVADVLASDSDADGDTLTITGVGSPTANNATVTLSGGWIFYVPPGGFTGVDSFTYTVSDTRGGSTQGTVNVTLLDDNGQSHNQSSIQDLGSGVFRITFNGIPGRTYTIQYTDSLSPPNTVWTTLGTATADALGVYTFDDHSGSVSRFYRSTYP